MRTLVLPKCLDTVPFVIYHSNTICQAVGKSSLKLPSSCPTRCSFPLKASNRDACRLLLLRTQVPAHRRIHLMKKRQKGRCNGWKSLHYQTCFQTLTRHATQAWRASICQSKQCLGLTGASRVQDRSASVQNLPVEAGFWSVRDNIYVPGWAAQCLFDKVTTSMEQHWAGRRGALEPGTAIALFSGNLGLKSCHHNVGGDTSHVEISWPVVMDAQVLVTGFLCVAVGS